MKTIIEYDLTKDFDRLALTDKLWQQWSRIRTVEIDPDDSNLISFVFEDGSTLEIYGVHGYDHDINIGVTITERPK